ncbi:hypothetical protein HK405_009913, partial [Cladochytrium tenue]
MPAASSANATTAADRPRRPAGGPPPAVRWYLVLYNVLSAIAWLAVAVAAATYLPAHDHLYLRAGRAIAIVQSFAVLEIIHSALGLVRSPVLTTAMQVFSRLFLVWGVCAAFPFKTVVGHWAYTSMVLAWGVTEVVRYSFYCANLIAWQGPPYAALVWC